MLTREAFFFQGNGALRRRPTFLLRPVGCWSDLRMLAMMGKQNAAVLPDPVWAHAIRSLLASPMGIEYFWTGVGFV